MSSAPVMGHGEGVLSTAAGLVAAARQDLDRLGGGVAAQLDAARGAWTGQGGSAFWRLGQAWHDRHRVIVGALDGFEASLRATQRHFVHTDETQSASFVRQQQRLG